MKQHINESQWGEISQEDRTKLVEASWTQHPSKETKRLNGDFKGMSIGQMIEFLGYDYMRLNCCDIFESKELADALWSDCKQKLNEKT